MKKSAVSSHLFTSIFSIYNRLIKTCLLLLVLFFSTFNRTSRFSRIATDFATFAVSLVLMQSPKKLKKLLFPVSSLPCWRLPIQSFSISCLPPNATYLQGPTYTLTCVTQVWTTKSVKLHGKARRTNYGYRMVFARKFFHVRTDEEFRTMTGSYILTKVCN